MLLLAKQKKELAEGKLETPAAAQFLKYHIIGKLIWLYTFFTHGKETVMQVSPVSLLLTALFARMGTSVCLWWQLWSYRPPSVTINVHGGGVSIRVTSWQCQTGSR